MGKVSTIAYGVLGLVMLALLGYSAYALLQTLVHAFVSLDKVVATAVVAACATISAGFVTVIVTHRYTKDREIMEAHRPKKAEVYASFVDQVTGLVIGNKENKKAVVDEKGQVSPEFLDWAKKFHSNLLVWGSPSVIQAYVKFKMNAGSVQGLLIQDDLLREMRKDLGHNDKRLKRGELIKIFLSDPGEVDKMISEGKQV